MVNVPRDDYPQDADMRAFEAMAAGCLLVSRVPSEITAVGFHEGVHYVGLDTKTKLRGWLAISWIMRRNPQIAGLAAKRSCGSTHMTIERVSLEQIERSPGRFYAPARQWTEGRIRMHYMDYYAANRVLDCAYTQWRRLATSDLRHALACGKVVGRAWLAELRRGIASMKETEFNRIGGDGFRSSEQ